MDKNLKSKKHKKKTKIISFDNEIITRDHAEKVTFQQENFIKKPIESKISNLVDNKSDVQVKKQKRKKRKKEQSDEDNDSKKRTKSLEDSTEADVTKNNNADTNELGENTQKPKKESIRAQKRKKHIEVQEQKKLKTELALQQKSLTYLSKWKHCRSEWKFEKLRQVWLQQSLFDSAKVPDEFWDIAVEYFSGAKGHSRQVVLNEALKFIEQEENPDRQTADEPKLKRARDIVQYLQ